MAAPSTSSAEPRGSAAAAPSCASSPIALIDVLRWQDRLPAASLLVPRLALLAVALADRLLLAASALAAGRGGVLAAGRGPRGLGAATAAAKLGLELAQHVVHRRRASGRGRRGRLLRGRARGAALGRLAGARRRRCGGAALGGRRGT